jgi:hypothetical protein
VPFSTDKTRFAFCKKHGQTLDWLCSEMPLDRFDIELAMLISQASREQVTEALAYVKRIAAARPAGATDPQE